MRKKEGREEGKGKEGRKKERRKNIFFPQGKKISFC